MPRFVNLSEYSLSPHDSVDDIIAKWSGYKSLPYPDPNDDEEEYQRQMDEQYVRSCVNDVRVYNPSIRNTQVLVNDGGNAMAIICRDDEGCPITSFDTCVPNPDYALVDVMKAVIKVAVAENREAVIVHVKAMASHDVENQGENVWHYKTREDDERLFRHIGMQKHTVSETFRHLHADTKTVCLHDVWTLPLKSFEGLVMDMCKNPWDSRITLQIDGCQPMEMDASIVQYTRKFEFNGCYNSYTPSLSSQTKFRAILLKTPIVHLKSDKDDQYFRMKLNGEVYGPTCDSTCTEKSRCTKCFNYRRLNKLSIIHSDYDAFHPEICVIYGFKLPASLSYVSEGNKFQRGHFFKNDAKTLKQPIHIVEYNLAETLLDYPRHSLKETPTPVYKDFDSIICLPSPSQTEVAEESSVVAAQPRSPVAKIPKAIRLAVWDKYIGAERGIACCYCCRIHMIDKGREFHTGHVIAAAKGGSNQVENLRPICAECNHDMGTQDMRDYCREHYGRELDE
jgi:5-methylcytosine-specific restriction endonuclease McrA